MSADNLTVSGYSRTYCPHFVPDAIVELLEAFYTLWKYRRLTDSELQRLVLWDGEQSDKYGNIDQSDEVDLFELKINGMWIKVKLRAWRKWRGCSRKVGLSWSLRAPSEIKCIAGVFDCHFGNMQYIGPRWKRENYITLIAKLRGLYLLSTEQPVVSTYLDIQQIKFQDEMNIPNFDITPNLERRGKFKLMLSLSDLSLEDSKTFSPNCDFGWRFRLQCIDHRLHMLLDGPLPMDVGRVEMEVSVQYVIKGRRYKKPKQMLEFGRVLDVFHVNENVDVINVMYIEDLETGIDVEFEVVSVWELGFFLCGDLIPESDWMNYRIV